MRDVKAVCGQVIGLGRAGENNARQIIFDLQPWVDQYGEGTASLVVRRANDAHPYPVALAITDNRAAWTITDADTAQAGFGQAELLWMVGNTLAKSAIYTTYTAKALDAGKGDPWEDYLAAVQQTAKEAQDAAAEAKDAAANVKLPDAPTFKAVTILDRIINDSVHMQFNKDAIQVARNNNVAELTFKGDDSIIPGSEESGSFLFMFQAGEAQEQALLYSAITYDADTGQHVLHLLEANYDALCVRIDSSISTITHDGDLTTKKYVDDEIASQVGNINTILDSINGEAV